MPIDFGVGRGVHHGEPQGAGLEACEVVGAHELEALAERAAMLLDRQPHRRVRRVVDHQHAFEIRVVEPGDRVERLLEHLRRLVVRRDVDRNLRRGGVGHQRRRLDQPPRLAAEGDGRDFLDARQRDDDQRDQQQGAEPEREGGARHEIMSVPIGEHGGEPGADHIGGGSQRDRLPQRHRAHRQDRQRQQHAHQQRDAGKPPVIGIGDRAGPARTWAGARRRTCPNRGRRRLRRSSTAGRSPRRYCSRCHRPRRARRNRAARPPARCGRAWRS